MELFINPGEETFPRKSSIRTSLNRMAGNALIFYSVSWLSPTRGLSVCGQLTGGEEHRVNLHFPRRERQRLIANRFAVVRSYLLLCIINGFKLIWTFPFPGISNRFLQWATGEEVEGRGKRIVMKWYAMVGRERRSDQEERQRGKSNPINHLYELRCAFKLYFLPFLRSLLWLLAGWSAMRWTVVQCHARK